MASWTTIVRENVRCISVEGSRYYCSCCYCSPDRLQESPIVSPVCSRRSPPISPGARDEVSSREIKHDCSRLRGNLRARACFTLRPEAETREDAGGICIKSGVFLLLFFLLRRKTTRATPCKSGARKYERSDVIQYFVCRETNRFDTDINLGAIFRRWNSPAIETWERDILMFRE